MKLTRPTSTPSCVCMCVCVLTCVWKPEVNFRWLLDYHPSLVFENLVFTNVASKPLESTCVHLSPALRLQVCTATGAGSQVCTVTGAGSQVRTVTGAGSQVCTATGAGSQVYTATGAGSQVCTTINPGHVFIHWKCVFYPICSLELSEALTRTPVLLPYW